MRILDDAGFEPEEAAKAFRLVVTYIFGFALFSAPRSPPRARESTRQALAGLPAETHPHLTRLLWLMTLIDASIHREWLAAAARTAPEQIAHLICELYIRLGITGLIGDDQSFTLPLTQTELGEALGLSAVHVNRSLQQLRSEGLFTWQNQSVRILDWDGLQRRASFDARYLHLVRESR